MTDTPARTPWHLWVVGIAALLWNCLGGFDYLMTQTQNESYMSNFTPEQLEYFYGFPAWVVSAWAIAVWGGLLGSILLLLRKKLAVPVFLTVFVAVLVTTFHNFVLTNGLEIMGTFAAVFTVVVIAIAVGLWQYSKRMRARGLLT